MNSSPSDARPAGASPRVSVIVPVYNDGSRLGACLAAVETSTFRDFECIVVDDASTADPATAMAARHGARTIRLERRSGPARARNVGAQAARGDILLFVDADVLIDPRAMGIAVDALISNPEISAVFGSYDDRPGHPSLLSQYRNLYHHWVHQRARSEAFTFWTGLGAIWRDVYLEAGGLAEDYRRPSIEDIELGARLHSAGHRIRLEKSMQGKHMKQWRLRNLVGTDVLRRGAPWVALLLRHRHVPLDLNLDLRSRLATAFTAAFALSLVALMAFGHAAAALPALVLLATGSAVAGTSDLSRGRMAALALSVFGALAPLTVFALSPDPWAVLPAALLAAVVTAEIDFYRYAARKLGGAYLIALLPVRVAYYLGCLAALPLGLIQYLRSGGHMRLGLAPDR